MGHSCSSNKSKHNLTPVIEAPLRRTENFPINTSAHRLVSLPALKLKKKLANLREFL